MGALSATRRDKRCCKTMEGRRAFLIFNVLWLRIRRRGARLRTAPPSQRRRARAAELGCRSRCAHVCCVVLGYYDGTGRMQRGAASPSYQRRGRVGGIVWRLERTTCDEPRTIVATAQRSPRAHKRRSAVSEAEAAGAYADRQMKTGFVAARAGGAGQAPTVSGRGT